MSEPTSSAVRPGRQGRRAPAAASARGVAGVPGIVGAPMNRVVRLPVRERGRHVRLPEQDRTGRARTGSGGRIVRRHEALPLGNAARGGEPRDVDRLLQGDRQAEERAGLAARRGEVGGLGLGAGALEVPDDDGVQRAVIPLDPADVEVRQLARADPPGPQVGQQLGRARKGVHGRTQPPWTGWCEAMNSTNAGRPLAFSSKARLSAGMISDGLVTSSPWKPTARAMDDMHALA